MSRISRLGYLGFEVRDLEAWEGFATEALGLMLADRLDDGSLVFRMDENAQRIVLHPGPGDDLAYAGFEMADEASLRSLAQALEAAGVEVSEGAPEMATARRVDRLFRLTDPNGIPIELFCGPERSGEPFQSDRMPSGFSTGEEGLGHVLIVARDVEATNRFYRDLLGMRVSDWIEEELAPGVVVRATFLHANARHHTVAFGALPLAKRIHHFMLEVREMVDVGRAYDRCRDLGFGIANELGQHPNDRMFSFYAKSPSGFDVEIGCGGLKVDDAIWETTTYDRLSSWGHRPPTATRPFGATS
ncbi:MAG TPA: hypothetical protein ENI85_14390 [Deltaproteobacteria bacterium]|nr:hypothetical protein [Deltaproteobacteria bacterium]